MKLVEGTYRSDRAAPAEVHYTEGIPACPDHLGPTAKAEWQRVVGELSEVPGLLQVVDRAVLATYCTVYARVVHCETIIREKGMTYTATAKSGAELERFRPEVRVLEKATDQLRALAAEFGFTPASRTRVSAPKSDKPGGALGGYLG